MASFPTVSTLRQEVRVSIWSTLLHTILVAVIAIAAGLPQQVRAQGGGNANAVGASIEAAIQSAGTSSGTPASTPGSSESEGGYDTESSEGMESVDESGEVYDSGEGYDTESGYGYGGSVGTTAAARAQVWMMAGTQNVARALVGFFAPSNTPAPLQLDRMSLWEQASLAFFHGDQRKTLGLYHAHIIADGAMAESAKKEVRFSRLLRRPVWLVRFGISVHPRVPDQYLTDPKPLREGMQTGLAMRHGGSSEDDGSDQGGFEEESGSPDGDGTGSEDMSMESDGDSSAPQALSVVTTLGGVRTEEAAKALDKYLGVVADVIKTRFTALQDAGKFGPAFNAMESAGKKFAAQATDASNAVSAGLPMWVPGMDYVGEGPSNEMLASAKTNQIDLLLHFDILVKENRLGEPSYTTRCKLLNVDNGETIAVSKPIDKSEILGKRMTIRNSIEEQLATLFDIIEKKAVVETMPTLQPQQAVARIDSLLASPKTGALRDLAEISMYRSRELITPELLDKAFFFAGGEDALLLIHDAEAQRYEKANELLQQELNGESSK